MDGALHGCQGLFRNRCGSVGLRTPGATIEADRMNCTEEVFSFGVNHVFSRGVERCLRA